MFVIGPRVTRPSILNSEREQKRPKPGIDEPLQRQFVNTVTKVVKLTGIRSQTCQRYNLG